MWDNQSIQLPCFQTQPAFAFQASPIAPTGSTAVGPTNIAAYDLSDLGLDAACAQGASARITFISCSLPVSTTY